MVTSLRVEVVCEYCRQTIPAGDLCYRVTAMIKKQVDRIYICRECIVEANEGLNGSPSKKS